MTFRERGHSPNTLRLWPLTTVTTNEYGITFARRGQRRYYKWSDIKSACIWNEEIHNGYGAHASTKMIKRTFETLTADGRTYGIATVGNALKVLWCTCCLAVLAVTLWNQEAYPEDAGIFFVLTMMALTFPICLGVELFTGAAILMTGIAELPNHWVVTLAGWAMFVIPGYVQWFILVPAMLDRGRPISIFGTRH